MVGSCIGKRDAHSSPKRGAHAPVKSTLWLDGNPGDYFSGISVSGPREVQQEKERTGSFTEDERMPTYDYACRKCGHNFQRIEKISDHGTKKIKCPECKSTRVEQVFTSVFVKTAKKS
jgi:putative FmdB family regulatory protein